MRSELLFGHFMDAVDTDVHIEVTMRKERKLFILVVTSQSYTVRVEMNAADFNNFIVHLDNVMSDFTGGRDTGDGG